MPAADLYSHHMFHRTAGVCSLGSGDGAMTFAYILGLVFITCMFAVMATDWDVQSILWFSCAGLAVIAMLLSMILRDSFEQTLCERLRYFKTEERRGYTALPAQPSGLMPRLTLVDLLRGP